MYNIAVVGESMSGKSTWIANLFDDNISKMLLDIFSKNNEGQTKIVAYYVLSPDNTQGLELTNIVWNRKALEEKTEEKEKVLSVIAETIDYSIEQLKNKINAGLYTLKKEINSSNVEIIFDNIVNNEKVSELELINYIEIRGVANPEIRKMLNINAQESICIKDTRGVFGETSQSIKEWIAEQEKGKTDKYLKENIKLGNIDACIWVCIAGSNTLNKKLAKDIYAPLLGELIKKCPIFLALRTDRITEKYVIGYKGTYKTLCEGIINNKAFAGFDGTEKLLEELGKGIDKLDYRAAIAYKHHKKLLLTDISNVLKNEKCISDICNQNAVDILKEVIEGIKKYQEDIEKAEKCYKEIKKDHREQLEDKFNELFKSKIEKWGDTYEISDYNYGIQYITGKILKNYYGGLVGENGGLTTYDYQNQSCVGDVAIELLEKAYIILEELYTDIIDSMDEQIREYCKMCIQDEEDMDIAVHDMKKKLKGKLSIHWESLSNVDRMIDREYLQDAQQKAKETLENWINNPEERYYNFFNEMKGSTEDERAYMLAVWSITRELIISVYNEK